jgi:hypothetical protein
MTTTAHIVGRLYGLVRGHNRELMFEILLRAFLGLVFSFFTFGFLFCLGWFFGWFVAGSLHLRPWQFGLLLAGLFFIVAVWSAWRQVDPLADLQPLTDEQWLLTQLSLASSNVLYFSPRHAVAGSAVLLLAGPRSVFQAFGLWTHRLRADRALIEEAAQLLRECTDTYPVQEIRQPAAALLLRHFALIKVVPQGASATLTLTEKGSKILSGAKGRKGKQPSLGPDQTPTRGPSLPLELARRGWSPHRFPQSKIVVFLPESIAADFDSEGVLLGSTRAKEIEFSATLHREFEHDRKGALDFVAHLARQKRRKVRDVGTYSFFFDPTEVDITATANRFWVIGVPGAVVVVSILCNGKIPLSEPLREVQKELPHIIGELL